MSKGVNMKYSIIGSFEFAQIIQRFSTLQTDAISANHICKITKEIEKARKKIHEEYMSEIREKYAKKDEAGNIDKTGAQPGDEMYFAPAEDKIEEFKKAQDEFGERLAHINWRPLHPGVLKEAKISAKEIDLLGDLYTPEHGPGVPHLHSV